MQERPVVCQDLASGVKLMDSKCSGPAAKDGCLGSGCLLKGSRVLYHPEAVEVPCV